MVSIDNSLNYVNSRPLTKEEKEIAKAIVNMPDHISRQAAVAAAYDQYQSSPGTKASKLFSDTLPVTDSLVRGATAKGTLSTKFGTTADNLKDWGVFLVVTKLYDKITNKIVEKCPPLQRFQEKHPAVSNLLGLGGAVGTGIAGIHYTNKLLNNVATRLQQKPNKNNVLMFIEGVLTGKHLEKIDTTKVGKNINSGIEKLADNSTAKKLGAAARLAIPLLAIGFIVKAVKDRANFVKNAERNYNEIQQTKLEVAKALINESLTTEETGE